MVTLQGRYGQVSGPFRAGVNLLAADGPISLQTPESSAPILYKLGIVAPADTRVQINDAIVKISKFGVLELDEVVNVYKLIFPDGADSDVIIDYVY